METDTVLFFVGPEAVLSTQHCLPGAWSHYSSKTQEHNQWLVKAILDQVVNCEQGVWTLPDSEVSGKKKGQSHRWRLKGCQDGSDNKIIVLAFSYNSMFLFNWPAGSFCWFLWGCLLMYMDNTQHGQVLCRTFYKWELGWSNSSVSTVGKKTKQQTTKRLKENYL